MLTLFELFVFKITIVVLHTQIDYAHNNVAIERQNWLYAFHVDGYYPYKIQFNLKGRTTRSKKNTTMRNEATSVREHPQLPVASY